MRGASRRSRRCSREVPIRAGRGPVPPDRRRSLKSRSLTHVQYEHNSSPKRTMADSAAANSCANSIFFTNLKRGAWMMRKALLWGAAASIIFASTAGVANVVVVKSLGPSAKAYPPGKTLPETAKISLQGGDVVTVLGPASAQTLRGPGSFDAKQVALASAAGQRGRFGALR